ncbi:hypothetical protein ES705_43021 [subsurface metagenome]
MYDLQDSPESGTGGYGFYDSPNDTDTEYEHMYRYEYSGGSTVDIWNSDGIEDVEHQVRPIDDPLIQNSDFGSIEPLDPNIPIQ